MALKKQVTLKSNFGDDVVFNDAYIKIIALSGDKESMRIEVGTHKNADSLALYCRQYYFVPDLSGNNFIAQGYAHLKTMSEFAGATDC